MLMSVVASNSINSVELISKYTMATHHLELPFAHHCNHLCLAFICVFKVPFQWLFATLYQAFWAVCFSGRNPIGLTVVPT